MFSAFISLTRQDHLARSTRHLCQMTDLLQQKKMQLQLLDQNLNTGEAVGRLFFYYAQRH